jgi:hypothetical protein
MIDEIAPPLKAERVRKRSSGLSFLLILTFIGSGIGFFMTIVLAFGGNWAGFFKTLPVVDTILRDDSIGNWLYIAVKIIIYGASLTGAVFMWKLKSPGFWIYFSAQILLLAIPFLFLRELGISYLLVRLLTNAVFTLLFIMLYAIRLKQMD